MRRFRRTRRTISTFHTAAQWDGAGDACENQSRRRACAERAEPESIAASMFLPQAPLECADPAPPGRETPAA